MDELRVSLLDQLAYLIDEVTAVQAVIHRVSEPLQVARPTGQEPSIRELYGLIVHRTEDELLPWVRALAAGEMPEGSTQPDEVWLAGATWNDVPMDTILERVTTARQALLDRLRALPETAWNRPLHIDGEEQTVLHLVHRLIQHDTAYLRTIGHRLHEAHLTHRKEDLPK